LHAVYVTVERDALLSLAYEAACTLEALHDLLRRGEAKVRPRVCVREAGYTIDLKRAREEDEDDLPRA
jgi:hypothetical protein